MAKLYMHERRMLNRSSTAHVQELSHVFKCTLNGERSEDSVRGGNTPENKVRNERIESDFHLTSFPGCTAVSYEPGGKTEAFYTGGDVHFTADGVHVLTTCGSAVKVLTVDTGRVERSIEEVSSLPGMCSHVTIT